MLLYEGEGGEEQIESRRGAKEVKKNIMQC